MRKGKRRARLMKSKGWGWMILLCLVLTFAVHSPLQAAASKASFQVDYLNGKLTVNADHVALGSVLAAIREKTGIEFVLSPEESERRISIQFGPLPLVEGLQRMLSHFNHAFVLGVDNRPVKVVIVGYAGPDGSPEPREVTAGSSGPKVHSPSSAEAGDIRLGPKEGWEEMVVKPSTETMIVHPPAGEEMMTTPSLETLVIKSPSVEMIVTPITGAMVSLVENMIIRGSTGASNPNFR